MIEQSQQNDIIIYQTDDGSVSVAMYAKDGSVWLNQTQLAELFATSIPNISMHIANILADKELIKNSVIKDYLTTANYEQDLAELKQLESKIKQRKTK